MLKAHRLWYLSTLGSRVIQKKKRRFRQHTAPDGAPLAWIKSRVSNASISIRGRRILKSCGTNPETRKGDLLPL